MTGKIALLITLVALHLTKGDEHPFTLSAGLCPGAPEADWNENIKSYLRHIPNNVTLPDIYAQTRSGGLELSPPHLYGLGSLWTYKPYYTYCTGKDSFIEVTAIAHEPLVVEMDWKICGGIAGQMVVKGNAKQLRLIFKVLPTAEDSTNLVLSKIHADIVEDSKFHLTGVPQGIKKFVKYVSYFMKYHVEKVWSAIFRMDGHFFVSSHPPQ